MRTRNVVREDLRKTVAKCKNTQSIETILKIAEIYRKVYDNATYEEVSELQWEQRLMINKVMDSTSFLANCLSFTFCCCSVVSFFFSLRFSPPG